jgi:hypothetical protein
MCFQPQNTQRGRAATEIKIISRKARKDRQVKSSNFLEAQGLGGLCALGALGAEIPPFLIAAVGEKFAHLAQILK